MKVFRIVSVLLLVAGIVGLQGMEQKFPIQQLPEGVRLEVCKNLKRTKTRYIDIVEFFKDLHAWRCTCKDFKKIAQSQQIQNLCKQLKELVAKNNKIDERGQAPLHNEISILVSNKKSPRETLMQLLNTGANVNKDNKHGETPLYFTAILGQPELTELLLEYGADINKTDNKGHGCTPLHMATLQGWENTVKLLIANGADVTKTTNRGQTAWGIAKEKGHEEIATLLAAAEEEQEKRQQQNEKSEENKKHKKECAIQ